MSLNDELLDAAIRHSIYLERFKGGLANKLVAQLNRADADLVAQIAKRDPTAVQGAWSLKRLERLLEELRAINRDAYNALGRELRSELRDLAVYEAGFQADLIREAVPITLNIVQPATEQLYAAVAARPFQGRLLKEWVQGLEQARAARLRDAIRIGFVEGETIDQMVRRVRGTRARGFKDGILEIDRRGAEAAVRTAVNHTANVARRELYAANDDLIKGVQWVSTLDGRASAVCRARDNEVYPVDSGPRPPAHWNCRSSTTPILKSWRELGIDLDEAPPGTRASMDGEVPASLSYGDWLKRQPADFQDEVLGVTKGRLFREGGLSVDKFVDRRGNELTLDELRRRERAAFERAGLE